MYAGYRNRRRQTNQEQYFEFIVCLHKKTLYRWIGMMIEKKEDRNRRIFAKKIDHSQDGIGLWYVKD